MSRLDLDTGEVETEIDCITWAGRGRGTDSIAEYDGSRVVLEVEGEELYLSKKDLPKLAKAFNKANELWGATDEE